MNKDCVSLEVAKKLKEAGWHEDDGEGKFYWSYVSCGDGCREPGHTHGGWNLMIGKRSHDAKPAPTIGELLEALPEGTHLHKETCWDPPFTYLAQSLDSKCIGNSPADALAMLWIELNQK